MTGSISGFWTEERVAELIRLVGKKNSAGLVAQKMRTTRNTIIGKAARIGLDLSFKPVFMVDRTFHDPNGHKVRNHKPIDGRKKPNNSAAINAVRRSKDNPAAAALPPEPPAPPECKRVTFAELDDCASHPAMCRWPVGDPQRPRLAYCGCETAPEKPYCSWHDAVAHGRSS